MDSLIVGFLVKLLDIPAAFVGIFGGWYSKTWLHVVIVAFIGGSIGEIVLFVLRDARKFDLTVWLVGVAACFTWAAAAYLIRTLRNRSE